ncbi:hypothetical protein BGZ89_010961 [Linnemannia elongata]|nr:hypothetical protein BGZ89_010961 [Linnemannia elongata]
MILRSSRLGTRQTPESVSTAAASSSSAGQNVDSTDPPVDDAVTTTQDDVTAKIAKRKRPKKQADTSIKPKTHSHGNESLNQVKSNAGEGSSGASKKEDRPKKRNKRVTSSSVTTPATSASTKPEGNAPIIAVPVNRSDPCAVLPTETWHRILSYLPLVKVAQTSFVSKAWLDGSRTSQLWKTICDKGGLGKPKLKYKSYMALACANSFWICDGCLSVTKGRPRTSYIPLPVFFPISPVADTRHKELDVWMLCFECRRKHYDDAPEDLHADTIGEEHIYYDGMIQMVAKTEAGKTYGLTEEDLKDLEYVVRPNPHYWRGQPMRLYERDKVQQLALVTHAGWVGVDAVRDGAARRRLTLFNQRAKEVQTDSRAHSSQ